MSIKLSREKLYKMVWNKPLMHLAKELGISDRGLAKACIRLEIPLPGRGYWRKVELGQKVEQETLQPATAVYNNFAWFNGPQEKPEPTNFNIDSQFVADSIEFEGKSSNRIRVPKTIHQYHPLVKKTLNELLETSWGKQGIFNPQEEECLDLNTTKELAPRAAKIYHVLIQECEKRGFKVSVTKGYSNDTYISCHGEKIKVSMREKLKQVPFKPAPGQKPNSYDPKVTYIPSGKLALRIDEYTSDSKHHCIDSDAGPLEEQLNEFMIRLAKAALYVKHRKAEDKLREEKWEQLRLENERKRQLAARNQARMENLESMALDWFKAKRIREFIEHLESSGLSFSDEDMTTSEWLVWAKDYANTIDPSHLESNTERPLEEPKKDWLFNPADNLLNESFFQRRMRKY